MPAAVHRGEILHCLADPLVEGESAVKHFSDGMLVLEDGIITACGPASDIEGKIPKHADVTRHSNGLIVPGMIDTHIHYPQCGVIASYGTQLIDWLETYTFPAELEFADSETARHNAEFFLDQLLANGTTTALVFGTVHPQSVEAFFAAAGARNLRMICGKVMMDRHAPAELCDTPRTGYEQSQALIKKWHGKGRLGYAVTPRFAPTSSSEQLTMAGRLLEENPGVHLHTHLSENPDELGWVSKLFPEHEDYFDVYDKHGLLGRRSVFAHGIHLSRREWKRMRKTGSNIAFCPTSNLFIGSGLFNLAAADEHNIRVGLGTDVGGGDSFSLLRTINEAYKVQQLQGNNLSPFRALYLATLGGALALDLQTHIGNFETGKEGDFIVLDYRATPLIQFRLERARDIRETLFVLQMLGDDRAVRETWIMGEKQFPN